jgi:hypothetical protein
MSFIQRIITKYFIKTEIKPLGRWNIDYCNEKMNKKVDLSNEDHCGPCGQYIIEKTQDKPVVTKPINKLSFTKITK